MTDLEEINYAVKDGELCLIPSFLEEKEADELYSLLLEKIPWKQDSIVLYGNKHPLPRLQCLMGEPNIQYTYSKIPMSAISWTPEILALKQIIESFSGEKFNSVLINLYRDGSDSNGWHADNEQELGQDPFIASISLGVPRKFKLKHNTIADKKLDILLTHGSLLLMGGSLQHHWKHQIPKSATIKEPRINLTFRLIHS